MYFPVLSFFSVEQDLLQSYTISRHTKGTLLSIASSVLTSCLQDWKILGGLLMESSLNLLLYIEDIGNADLVRQSLAESELEFVIFGVDSNKAFERELAEREFDIIIADLSHWATIEGILGGDTNTISLSPDAPLLYVSHTTDSTAAIRHLHSEIPRFIDVCTIDTLIPALTRAMGTRIALLRQKATRNESSSIYYAFETLIENIPDAILYEDSDRYVRYVNKPFNIFFGTDTDKPIVKPVKSAQIFDKIKNRFNQPEDFSSGTEKRFTERIHVLNEEIKSADGRVFERDCIPVYTEKGFQGVVWKFRDGTNGKKSIEDLRKSEERHRLFFEEDLTGDFVADTHGIITACNPRFLSIFGFSSYQEAIGRDFYSLYADVSTGTVVRYKIKNKQRVEYVEQVMRRRDGEQIYVVTSLAGKYDHDDKVLELRGYLFDDTLRKRLEQHLLQAHKLESVSTLAGGIAHDFNNIFGIILGHTSLMERRLTDPEKLRKSTETITAAIQRGASLVQQLLTFAHKSNVQMGIIRLHDIFSDVHNLLNEIFPKTTEISIRSNPHVPSLVGDRSQVHQALLHLCINARDAMPEGGMLSVDARVITRDELDDKFGQAKDDAYICISVTDTGIGMDAMLQSRIFEPFFTTKETGKGTGLGLSFVYGVVTGHNGFIDVVSDIGRGTTFYLYFPVHPIDEVVQTVVTKESGDVEGGSETVLLVEDEHALLEIVADFLNDKGYKVIPAHDGIEAVELYRKFKDRIDVVISDIGLPKLGGLEVTRRIRDLNPNAKCILASGYTDSDESERIRISGGSHFIEKPYKPVELLLKLKEVLADSGHNGVGST
jgi:two-component system, cell cycle sensor histidine kinase and response regulator CckA